MRRLLCLAFCLSVLLCCQFSKVHSCGQPAIRPLAGKDSILERAFQLNPQGRVIGGTVAKANSWPWMVMLIYPLTTDGGRSNSNYLCGATIISDRWLLTAAHCAIDMDIKRAKAYVGIQSRYGPNIGKFPYYVQKKVVHSSYNRKTIVNDIALLQLSSKLSFNTDVQPICLPFPSNDSSLMKSGSNGYVTGWGQYTDNSGAVPPESSAKLRQASLPFIDPEKCKATWPDLVVSSQICAGAFRKGTGEGDSGGPLEVKGYDNRWYQVGITSFGYDSHEGLIDQGTYPGHYVFHIIFFVFVHGEEMMESNKREHLAFKKAKHIECTLPSYL